MESKRGGKRSGAGRKRGSANLKTQAIAVKLAEDGEILPLAVMVKTMRGLWAVARRPDGTLDMDKAKEACGIAYQAAPYMHAKLSNTTVKGDADSPLTIQVIRFADDPAPG